MLIIAERINASRKYIAEAISSQNAGILIERCPISRYWVMVIRYWFTGFECRLLYFTLR